MKKQIIESLRKNCDVHLKPSKVCDGVGLFALIDIPKNKILFSDLTPDILLIDWEEVSYLSSEVKEYLKRMCISDEKGFRLNRTASHINISYFINHSDNPNVAHDLDIDRYVTTRDISKGEEILCKYTKQEIDWIIWKS